MIVHNYADFDDGGYYMRQRYCDILGVRLDSSKEEIRNAYKQLASLYKPDGDKKGSSEKWREIRKAYNYLMGYRKHNYRYRRVHISDSSMHTCFILLGVIYFAYFIINTIADKDIQVILFGSFISLIANIVVFMAIPFIYSQVKDRMIMKKYKRVCLWNSIFWLIFYMACGFKIGFGNLLSFYYINTHLIPYFHKGVYEKIE